MTRCFPTREIVNWAIQLLRSKTNSFLWILLYSIAKVCFILKNSSVTNINKVINLVQKFFYLINYVDPVMYQLFLKKTMHVVEKHSKLSLSVPKIVFFLISKEWGWEIWPKPKRVLICNIPPSEKHLIVD